MAFAVVLLTLVLVVIAYVRLIKNRKSKRRIECNLPPGPRKLPIIGDLHYIGALPHRSLWSLSLKYGPIMYLKLGSVPTVVVSSASMAKEMLKIHDLDCCSRPSLVVFDKYSYGRLDVSFATFGEHWRQMRKNFIVELFSTIRVHSFSAIREEEVHLMLEAIANASPKPVNLSEKLMSLSSNIICKAALGRRCLEDGNGENKFHKLFKKAQTSFVDFYFSDYFPALKWLDMCTGKLINVDKLIAEFDAFYEEIIQEHLDPKRVDPDHEDMVDILLRLQREANLTRDHIKASLMDIFMAGTETTSSVIAWAMSELIWNPAELKKAQEEVRGLIGLKGNVEEVDLHQFQYLNCVIKETMRLHHPVPLLLPHETIRHFKIDGYDILPKTRVLINAWAIGRNPEYWSNPEKFIPERFMGNSIDVKGQDFELLPFGAGRRMCPAMNFGLLTIEIALANLLYSFDWKLPDKISEDAFDLEEAPGLVIQKKSDLYLVGIKHDI